jgi:hypothetical protein
MNAPQPTSPRRRMQELLAIPDSQRTEAEWDELIELEITMAPGNREGAPQPTGRRPEAGSGGRKPGGGRHVKPGGPQARQGQQGQGQGQQGQGGPRPPAQPKPQGQPKVGDDGQPRKPARKFRKRPPKETPPQSE